MDLIVFTAQTARIITVKITVVQKYMSHLFQQTQVIISLGFGALWAQPFSSLSWSSLLSGWGTLENVESYSTIFTKVTTKISTTLSTTLTTKAPAFRQHTTKTPRWLQDSPWGLRDNPWWLQDNPWWLQDSLWCMDILRLLSSSLGTWWLTQSGSRCPRTQWLSHSLRHSPG